MFYGYHFRPFQEIFNTCDEMHAQILLRARWCAMCIFLFLKFIFELMYLCINKFASKVWKKNSPMFYVQCVKMGESRTHSHIHSWPFLLR